MNAQSYIDKVHKIKELKSTVKQLNFDKQHLNDLNGALKNENTELENKYKKLLDKLQKGSYYIVVENDIIVDGGALPPEAIILYPSQLEVDESELLKGYCEFKDNKVTANNEIKERYLKTFK